MLSGVVVLVMAAIGENCGNDVMLTILNFQEFLSIFPPLKFLHFS